MAAVDQPARVEVDCGCRLGPLQRIWTSFGYDELNWTATPRGRENLATLRAIGDVPYTVRAHNLFTSGSGRGLPHWGSGNLYHEDIEGRSFYDWSVADPVFDAWVSADLRPIVELGFCPRALVPATAQLPFTPMASQYGPYEAGLWAFPPSSLDRWRDLVAATVEHFWARYGREVVGTWYWELWNEPDISYWQGTIDEYCRLYDVTVAAITTILPEAAVGGPATTGRGSTFLEQFLAHCAGGTNAVSGGRGTRLDFVSFHTKGAHFEPWRTYGPLGPEGAATPERASPSTAKMLDEIHRNLRVIERFPRFSGLPVLVDECDASVPAHWGIYDNANFAYRNSAYYPVFQVQLMKKLLDLNEATSAHIQAATTWSWYLEGDRFFEGTRSLFTAANLATPLLNAYRLLARLPDQRLRVVSNRGRGLRQLEETAAESEIDGLAASNGHDRIVVLVWHHSDDRFHQDTAPVNLTIRDLPFAGRAARLRHYRIDHAHSNSYAAWVAAGRPWDPAPDQLAAIRAREGVEYYAPEAVIDPAPRDLTLTFDLPLPGVSLLELTSPDGPGER